MKDPANPSNEGRVFLYKFGKKIFDKITEAMQPAFADETPINPFDLWKGADFKVKIRKVEGYWNYDKSEFDSPSTLGDMDDNDLEAVWKKEYSLASFTADDQFKTYAELKTRLDTVLRNKPVNEVQEDLEDESEGRFTPNFNSPDITPSAPARAPAPAAEEDDALSYFAKLAEGE